MLTTNKTKPHTTVHMSWCTPSGFCIPKATTLKLSHITGARGEKLLPVFIQLFIYTEHTLCGTQKALIAINTYLYIKLIIYVRCLIQT